MIEVDATFREEAAELLAELESALLELEEGPEDADAISRVFRALHTLKGTGAMAGFDAVSTLVHDVESVFELVRSGQLTVSRELIGLTLLARDQVKAMIDLGNDALFDKQETAELLAAFGKFLPNHDAADFPKTPQATKPFGDNAGTYRIRFRPPRDIFQRGLDPLGLLQELASLGECRCIAQTDAIPGLDELDPELCYLYWDIILTTVAGENAIRDVFIFIEDDSDLRIEMVDAGLEEGEESEAKKIGEILVERGDISLTELQTTLAERKRLGETLIERRLVDGGKIDAAIIEQERVRQVRQERQTAEATTSIRVRSEKLDALVDLVGEMVTVQARLSQANEGRSDPELAAITEDIERLTWEMRDQVLNIRMLPMGSTFGRFRRLVRDLKNELDKDVELTTEGAETALDKTVIERLHEPLAHLIRNSIDHGIESATLRQAAGKPVRGRIRLAASHCGPHVLIVISDDGRGLDLVAIRSRAIETGLIPASAEISDKELAALIFHPGLSTATAVTSISGRGVGMDVVKKAIDALRGTIEVTSRPGEGTSFTIRLPLTLAIIDGLLVKVEGGHFVFPLAAVEECIELKGSDAQHSHGRNLIRVRGDLVPFIRMRKEFHIEGAPPEIEQIVIVEAAGGRVGFVVDHVVGEHQTVIKNLGRLYRQITGVSGATILGDGTVALILDIHQLVDKVERQEKATGTHFDNIFTGGRV